MPKFLHVLMILGLLTLWLLLAFLRYVESKPNVSHEGWKQIYISVLKPFTFSQVLKFS